MRVFTSHHDDVRQSTCCMLTLPLFAVWTGQGERRRRCRVGESWHLQLAAQARELLQQRLHMLRRCAVADWALQPPQLSCCNVLCTTCTTASHFAVLASARAGGDTCASSAGGVHLKRATCLLAVRFADRQQACSNQQ